MSVELVRCPLCGFAFDPSANAACTTCPLTRNCPMICCPACGHVTLDPGRSILADLARRALTRRSAEPEETLGSGRPETEEAHA